jgi:hypothetical protein
MLTKMRTDKNVVVYLDLADIYYMERAIRPETSLEVLGEERYAQTVLGMRGGKVFGVLDTPEEIMDMLYPYPKEIPTVIQHGCGCKNND